MINVLGSGLAVDADSEAGYVYIEVPATSDPPGRRTLCLTVPESAQLRALLARAEQVVSTGIGDMKERP